MPDRFFNDMTESSRKKVAIVSEYFEKWSAIMIGHLKKESLRNPRVAVRIAYFDLFSGPGYYSCGTPSTPIRVLNHAINDQDCRTALISYFNDADPNIAQQLRANIQNLTNVRLLEHTPIVDEDVVGEEITKFFKEEDVIPSLLFADPFGYKGLTLDLINGVLRNFGAESIFFFNFNRIYAALTNPKVKSHIDALFGEELAETLRTRLTRARAQFHKNISNAKKEERRGIKRDWDAQRESLIMSVMTEALTKIHGKYVLRFRFESETRPGTTSHFLVYVSKHQLGFEIMQSIMSTHSSDRYQGVASFEHRTSETQQLSLIGPTPLDDLIYELPIIFRFSNVTRQQIWLEHSPGTNYIKSNYKEAMIALLDRGVITTNRPPRKNTFAEDIIASFPILLTCPDCLKTSLLKQSCYQCGAKQDDATAIAEANEKNCPKAFDYCHISKSNQKCCGVPALEIGWIMDADFKKACLVCCRCHKTIPSPSLAQRMSRPTE